MRNGLVSASPDNYCRVEQIKTRVVGKVVLFSTNNCDVILPTNDMHAADHTQTKANTQNEWCAVYQMSSLIVWIRRFLFFFHCMYTLTKTFSNL